MLVSQAAPARPEEKERYKVGDKIDGRFEILAVHLGGMGVVYGTFDHSQRMPRALKTLQLRFAERPGMRKLFTEEASVWVQLEKHPFIVRALIVQQYDGHPFVITEYIVGQQGMGCDLRSWLGHPRLTHAVAVEMALEIAQGMQHATRKVPGLLHRDLKPANVLVDDRGRALVTDFGLSRAAAAGAGTPAYMAPEQWHNGTLDQRTDIYAYGCVLYEMFSRHRLFACRSLEDWQAAHLERMPVAISQLARVPAEIEQFIFRCLAKDPNGRPANWDEVVEACAGWFYNLTGQPAVRDFSAYTLNEDELVGASHSLGQLRKYPEMLEVCNRLLAANPKSREGMINKIAALNELSRWDEALALIDQVLAMNARDAYAWSSRCVVLGHLGRNEESLAAIVESLAIDPNSSLAWRTKALALGRLGRTAEQLEAIEQALAVNRRDAAAWNTKAYVLQNTGRWKEAVEACDEALAINPIDTYALQARAVALEKVGRLDDAVADYERALAIDPEGVDEWLQRSAGRAWSSKGNALFQSGQFQQALAAFDRSLAINPRWAPSWIGRAAALERFARWPEKLAAAERAIELDPQSALAFQHKGIALGELNRLEDALEAYERACAISPNEANIKKRDALRERLLTHVAEEPVDPAALSYRAPAGQKPKQHPEAGYRSILVAKAAPVTAEEIERYKVGEKIGGRFEVLAIHRGGMGVVYGAFDHHERLPRALKTLQLRFAVNAGMRDLFASEAALWVRLEKHPYIVRAFLVNHYDGQPFVITEYVRGPAGMGSDLRSWLGHPRLTLPVAMEMALQIAQGMQHATRKVSGLLHRDLKPANVLVDDKGRALVTDFGLANAAASGAGTPAYMSPEQWRSGKLDPRTDIYGYGCILYEMFTGHRLFVAASLDEWKAAHLTRMPYPIARLADVPPELADFVFRCLAKDPNARPANWDEVVSTCADWFHRLTGQPAVLDFSAYSLQADELVAASHSMGQLRRYTEMLEICERMLARNPAHREALINKIAALDKLGRLDEALATINQVLAANPRDAMALDSKSVVLGRLRRNEESLAAIEQALAIDPGSSHAWGAKGHALDRLERFAESVVAYEKSLSIKRGDMDIWISLLQALGRLKRYDDVVVNADRAAAVNPVDERPWLEKDRAYQELGRYAEALAAADRALALNPKSFYAYYDKAYMFVRTGRWAEALESADRAIALQPSETYSWGLRRQALMNLERWEEALAAAERMLIIEPRHVAAWTGKGDALDKLGRAEDAVAAYDQALALNPRHSAAATARERLVKRIAGGGGILGLFKRK